MEEVAGAVKELIAAGKVRHFGLSEAGVEGFLTGPIGEGTTFASDTAATRPRRLRRSRRPGSPRSGRGSCRSRARRSSAGSRRTSLPRTSTSPDDLHEIDGARLEASGARNSEASRLLIDR